MRWHTALIITLFAITGCQKNADPASSDAGKAIYDQNCVACHGPDGNVRLASSHDAKTPDLRTIAQRSASGRLPRVMLAEVIDGRRVLEAHGDRSMPVWGEQLDPTDGTSVAADIDALISYIESIQVK